MKNKILAVTISSALLFGCGSKESKLTGTWVHHVTSDSPAKMAIYLEKDNIFVTITTPDKDKNVFVCESYSDKTHAPNLKCDAQNGKLFKQIDDKNVCLSTPMSNQCITYIEDSKSIKSSFNNANYTKFETK